MGKRVKCDKKRCLTCKYVMNLTGCGYIKDGSSGALIACGYILKTNESRIFNKGILRDDYEPGYCNMYEQGKRVRSKDDIFNHTTIKKGRKKSD